MGTTGKDLRETHIVDRACEERMLPMSHPGLVPLAQACVSLAGTSRLRGGYHIGRIDPPYHVAIGTISGRGVLRSRDGERLLTKNTLACLPAGLAYEYELDDPEWRIVWFHLSRRKRWRAFEKLGMRVVKEMRFASLATQVGAILDECHSPTHDAKRAVELHAGLLALHLGRMLASNGSAMAARHEEALRALWGTVDASLDAPWSVARLAREMHMAPGHLHRVVVDLHGTTPMAFVAGLRMQRAESLLRRGGLTVAQVAQRVGYSDAFAFSTAFKRWKGVPPSVLARE